MNLKKIKLFVIISVFAISSVFAANDADVNFMIYSAASNINLATDEGDKNIYHGYNNGSEDALIASVGITGTGNNTSIEIKNPSWIQSWTMKSASDPSAVSSFGLQIVVVDEDNQVGDSDIHSYGYNSSDIDSSELDLKVNGSNVYSYVNFYLVLPDNNVVDVADDYYVSFDIVVTSETGSHKGDSWSFHCIITGYYGENHGEQDSVILGVVPNSNATNINLEDTAIASKGIGLHIGDYFYSSLYQSSDGVDGKISAFVSSEPDPLAPAGKFTLSNSEYRFNYEIGLRAGSNTEWYAGYNPVDSAWTDNLLGSNRVDMAEIGGTGEYTQYTSDGEIYFRLSSDAIVDDIPAGEYTSNIYFHVVSEK